MNHRTFALKVIDKFNNQTIYSERVLEFLDSSIVTYTNAMTEIRAGVADFLPECAWLREKIKKYGSVVILDGPHDEHTRQLSLRELEYLIDHAHQLKIKLESDALMSNEPFIYADIRASRRMIHLSILNESVRCPDCEQIILTGLLEDHRMHPRCKDNQLIHQFTTQKLIAVEDDNDVEELTQTRNIPIQYQPIGYRMIIPAWAYAAIETFKNNKNGYAGMTLHEYLDRLIPPK